MLNLDRRKFEKVLKSLLKFSPTFPIRASEISGLEGFTSITYTLENAFTYLCTLCLVENAVNSFVGIFMLDHQLFCS